MNAVVVHVGSAVPELEPDLHAVCDLCAQNVPPDDGYLWVDNDEIARCEQKTAAWEAEHPATENMTGDNLRTRPGPARWRVTHTACDPGSRGDAYAIELDRISTFRDLAGWTIHLQGKKWFRYTDWDELAEDALGAGGGRLVSRYTEPWHG
ncbi:hypothetical protein [Actinoplanes derwentensis]|uniref:Uncharacterized protein n=1 Tax=Actinoplanes derwentensis TaxID=113562 RepID=A0A1H1S2X4_9ACTN|nr:hypothetical protein [Actinoplanes derwentensis]GID89654.1 hypothetical protein Ade03nite_85780 [Actinoplanes derwentensis]SDS42294.1 hypothetical protein SAMN04489716_0750 [Actinoplanes derwentensis]